MYSQVYYNSINEKLFRGFCKFVIIVLFIPICAWTDSQFCPVAADTDPVSKDWIRKLYLDNYWKVNRQSRLLMMLLRIITRRFRGPRVTQQENGRQ